MDKDFLKRFGKKLDTSLEQVRQARMESDRQRLMSTIGQDLAKMLQPFLVQIASSAKANKQDLQIAMSEAMGMLNSRDLQIDTTPLISAIESAFMGIQIPEPKVTVNMPEVKLPPIEFPPLDNIKGWMRLMANNHEVGYDNPLPVILYDHKGNPFKMLEGITQILNGGGGGGARIVKIGNTDDNPVPVSIQGAISATFSADFGSGEIGSETLRVVQATDAVSSVQVKEIFGSAATDVINPDGRIKVELPSGASGLTDTELRASAVPVTQVSGAAFSMFATGAAASFFAEIMNPDGRVKVELPAGATGLTDTELRASAVPVIQVSGGNWSTEVTNPYATTAASTLTNPDNRVKVELPTFTQAISVTDIFATSVASNVVNPDNRVKVELPATTVTVASITASTAVQPVDSTGVGYSGSNPFPVTIISESLASTIAVGDIASDGADTGSAPLKIGGIARTANPTAVAAGDRVSFTSDDLGRQLMRPVQVRDLIVTARASVSNGTETTLLAASAGSFHDLIYLMAANNSDAAVSLDIRCTTGGNVVMTIQIPASGTAGVSLPVPMPQDATGNNWTIDGPDETGRTITVSALFSREV